METCTLTYPASPVTRNLSPLLEAPELETYELGKMRVVDFDKHVHYWSSPQSEYQIHDFGVETPLFHDGLVWPRQNRSAITFRQTGMCLALGVMS